MNLELNYYLLFEITGRCNIKCKYCYNSGLSSNDYIKKELTKSEILSIIETAVNYHNCKKIVFSGGEPFLREDLFEIISEIQVPVVILTNGTILNSNCMNLLKRYNFSNKIEEIRVSYDGILAQGVMRDKKTVNLVIKNIEKLRNIGMPLAINTMITQSNINDLFALYKKIVIENQLKWLLDFPFYYGRWRNEHKDYEVKDIDLMFDNLQCIIEDFVSNDRHLEGKQIEIANYFSSHILEHGFHLIKEDDHPCAYSFGAITIKPNGDIGFCPTLDWIFGNISSISISDVPYQELFQKWISIKAKDVGDCIGCKYFPVCGTGCRADAYYQSGNLFSKDFNACLFISNFHKRVVPILPERLQILFKEMLYYQGWEPLESQGREYGEKVIQ